MDLQLSNPVEDAELTRALSDVMTHLRKRQYGDVLDHFEDALRGTGDAFVDILARHLLYEEQIMFPSLRRLDPNLSPDLLALQSEHGRLRELASELAVAMKADDLDQAYRVARTFLAELYTHIDHEARMQDLASRNLPGDSGPP